MPQVLKGVDSKTFIQNPFPGEAATKPIPKKYRVPELPKYNEITYPNEHITAFACTYVVKGNDTRYQETKFVLLKRFGEVLSNRAVMKHHSITHDPINSLIIPAYSVI